MAVLRRSGGVTVSVFAMVMAGVVVGVVCGMILGGMSTNQLLLAVISALVAAAVAVVVGSLFLDQEANSALPLGVSVWNIIIASLIGGLAGHELAIDLRDPPISPIIGGLSGLLAGILIASFAITAFTLRNQWAGLRQ